MWNTIKGALKSKTVWFNVVTGTLEIVNVLNGSVIPSAVAGTVITVGNIVLRFLTTKPLDQK
jgi:hypothetical protein